MNEYEPLREQDNGGARMDTNNEVLDDVFTFEGLGGVDKFEPVSGGCYMNHAEEAVG